MSDLETAFYIVALVYMGLMFILFIALLVAVMVIKSKIDAAHRRIEEKIDQAKSFAHKANLAAKTIRYFVKQ